MTVEVFYAAVQDGAGAKEQARAMARICRAVDMDHLLSPRDLVAVKVHVGEKGNKTYVKPALIRELVQHIKAAGALPFLTETSTLYKGRRENAVKHLLLAHGHGFSVEGVGAPFIMADGLVGNTEVEVPIDGELHRTVKIAREVAAADALLVVSHATGHIGTGLGACVKNLGMGLASRMGKMRQHSSIMPEVIARRCQACGKCRRWCPTEAIGVREGVSYIIRERCIGCGECLAVCRYDAVRYDFGIEAVELQKSMAEHAYGAVKDKRGKSCFFNVLLEMTKDCDCMNHPQKKIMPDIGILASDDPVAVDMATLDLTARQTGEDLAKRSYPHLDPMPQLAHAERLGMGTRKYDLKEVD